MPRSKTKALAPAGSALSPQEDALYAQVREILDGAKNRAARSINVEMTHAYWQIGQAIVEREQGGKERADYGAQLIESLSARLSAEGVKGFSVQNIWYMRQFYLAYPEKLHALRGELSWTHYRLLLKVEKEGAREFYERESVAGAWSTRELERQISTLYYERALMASDKAAILTDKREGGEKYQPQEFIKDPFVLECLGLPDPPASENELEDALLTHLQTFLLELGQGFSFVARQKRLTIDGDHFYIDLVFYNRLLRCFVLIDLKMGKLTHQDLGQMQLYTNYYTRELREDYENPAIGVLLCADKNEAVVRYTLPENQSQIFASKYALQMPSEAQLKAEIERETARLQNR